MICNDEKPARGLPDVATLASLDEFDAIIDARSPGEYEQDHIPGAINLPVLDDEERARVGTIYKQVSPFEAKRLGAALVSHNIARHLESYLADKPKKYRPLVYCWRGGTRSGSMTHVLRSIGWQAAQLEGGYKRYRTQLIADLESWPARFHFLVVCGPTGVGKSRLLRALAEAGGQVLDLEELAAHMGSVLGAYPAATEPEIFREPDLGCAASFRPGKAGLRRIRKQEDRQTAYTRRTAAANAEFGLSQFECGHPAQGPIAETGICPFSRFARPIEQTTRPFGDVAGS